MQHINIKLGIILVAVLVAFEACEKQPKPRTADFTYAGNMNSFESISFTSSTPGTVTYLWDFGDGSYSTEANPVHKYKRGGTFKVQLTVNADQNNIIKKQVDIVSIVQNIAGFYAHNYKRVSKQSVHWPVNHSNVRYYTDFARDSFNLLVLNDSVLEMTTLRLGGVGSHYTRNFLIVDSLHTDSTIIFACGSWEYITYHYTRDSLFFDKEIPISPDGKEIEVTSYKLMR